MRIAAWTRLQRLLFGVPLAIGLAVGVAAAGEPEVDPLADLKARLEALERQNEVLKDAAQRGGAIRPVSDDSGDQDPKAVQKMVDDHLKSKDDAKKKADDEAKQKITDEGYTVGSMLDFKAKWDHGVWFETEDKAFRFHVGGRTQFDTIWYEVPERMQIPPALGGIGDVHDAVAFRRARFAMEGTWYEVVNFNFEYDFVNTDRVLASTAGRTFDQYTPVPTDLWVEFVHLPIVENIRLGNQKPEISFEHLTSSRFLNFLERAYTFDAFTGGVDNGFRPGIQTYRNFLDDRLHFAAGVFKNNQNIFVFNSNDGQADFTTRLTGLPIYENDGRCLVHVGIGYSHRDLADDTTNQFRARTELRNGPATNHTVLHQIRFAGDSQDYLVPEFAFVWGPWSGAAEYHATWLHGIQAVDGELRPTGPVLGTAFYSGGYAEVLYFLTGEHRPYNRRIPGFTRVIPNENFFLVRGDDGPILGRGAWQVGARYSWIDLSDKNLGSTRGHTDAMTLGLNWFLNPNLKIQANYTLESRQVDVGPASGVLHGFGVRYAADF